MPLRPCLTCGAALAAWASPTMTAWLPNDARNAVRAWLALEPGGKGFAGYTERVDAPGIPIEEGGPWPNVSEALVWARHRAGQVVLRYGLDDASIFSAGNVPYDGDDGPLPSWPPSQHVLRRIHLEVGQFLKELDDPEAIATSSLEGIAEPEIQRSRRRPTGPGSDL